MPAFHPNISNYLKNFAIKNIMRQVLSPRAMIFVPERKTLKIKYYESIKITKADRLRNILLTQSNINNIT